MTPHDFGKEGAVLEQRVLIYTIALDPPGRSEHQNMARMLAASLLRTYFTGDILILHNSDAPLFRVEQKQVTERRIGASAEAGYTLKYSARRLIPAEHYDWVCFMDCDMLALRNVDHLFEVEDRTEILWQPEPKPQSAPAYNSYFREEEYARLWREGANSGTFAVRGSLYHEMMICWEAVDRQPPEREKACFDQAAWNRVIYDTPHRRKPFEKDEIQFPLLFHPHYLEWRGAALVHALGSRNPGIKMEFLMSQYLGRFLGEPPGPLLAMLMP
jgi:hypothetical protein